MGWLWRGIRASIRHVQFAAAMRFCRGKVSSLSNCRAKNLLGHLPRQYRLRDTAICAIIFFEIAAAKSRPRLFCRGKVPTQIILPRQSQKNNGTNRRVSQAILPRQVSRLIFGAAIAEARYFAAAKPLCRGKLNVSNTGTDPPP